MNRIPESLLNQLDLPAAVEAEARARRDHIPPEPWVEIALSKKQEVGKVVHGRLAAGLQVAPNVVINVRKARLGTRPVPIMGIAERVAYRALTSYVIGEGIEPDRSPDDYKDFLGGPIRYAFDETPGWFLGTSLKYVLEADIAGFYEYVDHQILSAELQLQTGKIEAIDVLLELLAETQKRSFGLPQMVDASDGLSEVYIGIVERDLVRAGWPVWRFNDDFRIGCRTYSEALYAIERLDESARAVGLMVSDHKRFTWTLAKYVATIAGLTIHEITADTHPSDVEAFVVSYDMLVDDQIETAVSTLNRVRFKNGTSDAIDLKQLKASEVGDLKRAVTTLTSHRDDAGLDVVTDLLIYVPSLTPSICEYLIAIGADGRTAEVAPIVESALNTVSLGEWQAIWISHLCRKLDLLAANAKGCLEWVKEQRERGRGRPLGAEAALALAGVCAIDFDDLDIALRAEPEALAPWFILGMKSIAVSKGGNYRRRCRAVGDSSPLNRLLLDV